MTKRQDAETRRLQILDAGLALAHRCGGYDKVTRDDLAERCGFRSGSLVQHHFKTMTAFRRALLRHAIEQEHVGVVAYALAAGNAYVKRRAPERLKRLAAQKLAG